MPKTKQKIKATEFSGTELEITAKCLNKIINVLKESPKVAPDIGIGNDSFYRTIIDSHQWKDWVLEVRRRMDEHIEKKSKIFTGCWDIDECIELGCISLGHFQDFMKFCSDKAVREREQEIVKKIEKWKDNLDGNYEFVGVEEETCDSIIDIINPNISSPLEERELR